MSLSTKDRIPLSIRWPVISTFSEDGTVVPGPVVGRRLSHRGDEVAEAPDEGADEERAHPAGDHDLEQDEQQADDRRAEQRDPGDPSPGLDRRERRRYRWDEVT